MVEIRSLYALGKSVMVSHANDNNILLRMFLLIWFVQALTDEFEKNISSQSSPK